MQHPRQRVANPLPITPPPGEPGERGDYSPDPHHAQVGLTYLGTTTRTAAKNLAAALQANVAHAEARVGRLPGTARRRNRRRTGAARPNADRGRLGRRAEDFGPDGIHERGGILMRR